jgi:hypothetical protein
VVGFFGSSISAPTAVCFKEAMFDDDERLGQLTTETA